MMRATNVIPIERERRPGMTKTWRAFQVPAGRTAGTPFVGARGATAVLLVVSGGCEIGDSGRRIRRMLKIKRVYEPREPGDGERILVDRLWPRGLSKRVAAVDRWMRELGPSHALRRWFGHDPDRWAEFRHGYRAELKTQPDALAELARKSRTRAVTLLFAARDTAHNNAVVLKDAIEHLQGHRRTPRRRAV